MTFRLRFAALLGRNLGRKSPSPGICEGWCSPVRFYASGDQVVGTEFRPRGWWHPADMSAQGAVVVRTRYYGQPGQRATGSRVISRPARITACSPARSTACRMCRAAEALVATRRPNDNLVGLERFRAADHHARTNPALPDGPLNRTRSGDRSNRRALAAALAGPMVRRRSSAYRRLGRRSPPGSQWPRGCGMATATWPEL